MRRLPAFGPFSAALAVAVSILALQALSALIPPLGLAIRQLPLIPIVLVCATLLICVRMFRAR